MPGSRVPRRLCWLVCTLGTLACGSSASTSGDETSGGSSGTTTPRPTTASTSDPNTSSSSTTPASSSSAGTTGEPGSTSSGNEDTGTTTGETDASSSTGEAPAISQPFDCNWAPPTTLAIRGDTIGNFEQGTLVMDRAGAITSAVWATRYPKGLPLIALLLNRFDPESQHWGKSEVVEVPQNYNSVRVAADGNDDGEAWHAWTFASRVYGVRFDPTTQWGEFSEVGGNGKSFQDLLSQAVTMDEEGDIMQLWRQHDHSAWARRYDSSEGAWDPPHLLAALPEGLSELTALSVDSVGSGGAVAAWSRNALDAGLYISTYDVATGWSEGMRIGDGARPFVLGNAQGDAAIVIRTTELAAYIYDPQSQTWNLGEPFYTPNEGQQLANVRVAMDNEGGIMAIWLSTVGPQDLWASRYDPQDQAWSEAEIISSGHVNEPLLAVNAAGHAIATYHASAGFATRCYNVVADAWGETNLTDVPGENLSWALTGNDDGHAAFMITGRAEVKDEEYDAVFVYQDPSEGAFSNH